MALINCPECGREVSDKAPTCIHCGYPLITKEKNTICEIKGQKYDLSKILKMCQNNEPPYATREAIEKITPLIFGDAVELGRIIRENGEIPTSYIPKTYTRTIKEEPKCPHCKSTEIKKLDIINRSVSIGIFGLGSNKINKSFQCKKCKYTW